MYFCSFVHFTVGTHTRPSPEKNAPFSQGSLLPFVLLLEKYTQRTPDTHRMAQSRSKASDPPIVAPRPLKQTLGSPITPRHVQPSTPTPERRSASSQAESLRKADDSSPSKLNTSEEKPEIRDLYLEAEKELKEIVGGFTHTFVHNLLRDVARTTAESLMYASGELEEGAFEPLEESAYPMDRSSVSFRSARVGSWEGEPFFPMEVSYRSSCSVLFY